MPPEHSCQPYRDWIASDKWPFEFVKQSKGIATAKMIYTLKYLNYVTSCSPTMKTKRSG